MEIIFYKDTVKILNYMHIYICTENNAGLCSGTAWHLVNPVSGAGGGNSNRVQCHAYTAFTFRDDNFKEDKQRVSVTLYDKNKH